MMEVLANTAVVTIMYYINVSNQYIAHLKLIQCYMSYISVFLKEMHSIYGFKIKKFAGDHKEHNSQNQAQLT